MFHEIYVKVNQAETLYEKMGLISEAKSNIASLESNLEYFKGKSSIKQSETETIKKEIKTLEYRVLEKFYNENPLAKEVSIGNRSYTELIKKTKPILASLNPEKARANYPDKEFLKTFNLSKTIKEIERVGAYQRDIDLVSELSKKKYSEHPGLNTNQEVLQLLKKPKTWLGPGVGALMGLPMGLYNPLTYCGLVTALTVLTLGMIYGVTRAYKKMEQDSRYTSLEFMAETADRYLTGLLKLQTA